MELHYPIFCLEVYEDLSDLIPKINERAKELALLKN